MNSFIDELVQGWPDAEHEIKGLTTAAGIWTTAAVGVVVGLGHRGLAALGVAMTLFTLAMRASAGRAL